MTEKKKPTAAERKAARDEWANRPAVNPRRDRLIRPKPMGSAA